MVLLLFSVFSVKMKIRISWSFIIYDVGYTPCISLKSKMLLRKIKRKNRVQRRNLIETMHMDYSQPLDMSSPKTIQVR